MLFEILSCTWNKQNETEECILWTLWKGQWVIYVYVNLVRAVLESLVPNFTLGPSWSIHCCLRPWFSLLQLLYHLCGLLYAYLICEGVKGVGRKCGVGGSYFVLWHFFWLSLNNLLICEMGRRGGKLRESCSTFPGEGWKSNLSFSSAQEVAEKAVGISLSLYILWEGCQLFYFKGCMGENLRYILKNTLWKWLKWV